MDTNPNQFKSAELVPVTPAPSDAEPEKKDELKEKARKHTDEALQVLVDVMKTGRSESARIQAASTVLERGWGKSKQEVEVTQQVTYQDLLKKIRNNENKFIEIIDVTAIPVAPPAPLSMDDLI